MLMMSMGVNLLGVVVTALFAVVAAWGTSRLLDRANAAARRSTGSDALSAWGAVLTKIESEAMPCAIYYAARWLGLCLLYGQLFSRMV